MTAPPTRTWLVRVGTLARAIRDGWVAIGLALVLIVVAEASLRVATVVWSRLGASPVSASEQPEWMPAYLEEHGRATDAQVWSPYVYYRTAPFHGEFINIDEDSSRLTVQGPLPADAPDVFLMGGSTMFGSYQRDRGTLPSALGRYFESCRGPIPRLHNFGQSGRVFTHEVIDLELKLRAGQTPAVALFYDGINDVAAAVQRNQPGLPINENHRVRDFELGRDVFWWERSVRADARAAGRLLVSGAERLQTLQRLRRYLPVPAPSPSGTPSAPLTPEALAASYVETARWVVALGHEYGFVPVFIWQPTIHTTGKALTDAEAALLDGVEAGPYGRRLVAMHRGVAAPLSAEAPPVLGTSFHDLSDAFDDESEAIFYDGIGHTNEYANEVLAAAIGPIIVEALGEQGALIACGARGDVDN